MPELSLLIPSRNEQFLLNTVQDILVHSKADTEVIVVLDGWECNIPETEKVRVIRHSQSIGQRAATNEAARLSQAKYVMKVDAHCSFADGFDEIMLRDMQDDAAMVPVMKNLHVFDWVCPSGHRRYQGPSGPCKECNAPTRMDIKWFAKHAPNSSSYCFDTDPHFQYFEDWKKKPENQAKKIVETMSLQGSCFMVSRKMYFDLDLCGEEFGSWGSQGIEVAVKVWLSGGRVLCNKNTWYAHCFRTQGGDFGFPYPISGNQIHEAKLHARELFFENRWPKQVRPLSWLIEKFKPVPGWHFAKHGRSEIKHEPEVLDKVTKAGEEFNRTRAVLTAKKPSVGLVYYSDNHVPANLLTACQRQIKACCNGHDLVSVTLGAMDFGRNFPVDWERGYLTMFRQILKGIEEAKAEILFLVEHDVMYHPSHFDFIPPEKDKFYYDENHWMVRASDGHALFFNYMSVSALCAYRELLLEHYRARVAKVEKEGFTRYFGFEPGSHKPPRGCDNYGREAYFAKFPSLDIRHDSNLTHNRWRKDQYRNQRQLYAWTEKKVWELPGWSRDTLREILPNAISQA